MEVESNHKESNASNTSELDADLPPKGTPRFVIEKLVLENFKSYAGIKVGVLQRRKGLGSGFVP